MSYKFYITLLSIGGALSGNACASQGDEILRMLANAKLTGACGMLGQQMQFQEFAQMQGAHDFLMKFTEAEAARLEMTMDQYLSACRQATQSYNVTVDAIQEAGGR